MTLPMKSFFRPRSIPDHLEIAYFLYFFFYTELSSWVVHSRLLVATVMGSYDEGYLRLTLDYWSRPILSSSFGMDNPFNLGHQLLTPLWLSTIEIILLCILLTAMFRAAEPPESDGKCLWTTTEIIPARRLRILQLSTYSVPSHESIVSTFQSSGWLRTELDKHHVPDLGIFIVEKKKDATKPELIACIFPRYACHLSLYILVFSGWPKTMPTA